MTEHDADKPSVLRRRLVVVTTAAGGLAAVGSAVPFAAGMAPP